MRTTLSRRAFIGTSTLLALPTLVACAQETDQERDMRQSDSSVRAKVLRLGLVRDDAGIDMQVSTSPDSAALANAIVEPPLAMDDEGNLVGRLFAEVPVPEDDGVTYQCELRQNVQFHDGSSLTAEDVKFTFERMFRPETHGSSTELFSLIRGARDMMEGRANSLEGIRIKNDQELKIVLERPMASFAKGLAHGAAGVLPHKACEAAGSEWGRGTNLVGTGPFKLTEHDETHAVLERFEGHRDGVSNLAKIMVSYVSDREEAMQRFVEGDIDLCEIDATQAAEQTDDAATSELIESYQPLATQFVSLNEHVEPLGDPRVREALSLGIDRQALVEGVLSGMGEAAACLVCPGIAGHDDDAQIPPRDIERARALLEEAGVQDLRLKAQVRAQDVAVMSAVADDWADLGVRVSVDEVDDEEWRWLQEQGQLEVTTYAWLAPYPDAETVLHALFAREEAAKRSSFFDNDEFNDLVERARRADDDERAALYLRADQILTREEYAAIPLFYPTGYYVAREYVQNIRMVDNGLDLVSLDVDVSNAGYHGDEYDQQ